MPEGGFLIKFNDEEVARCYACAFDYDEWWYQINIDEKQDLPSDVRKITIILEFE